MAYGFMDPRNPYPFGYQPLDAVNALAAKPASAQQGFLPPGSPMDPAYRDPLSPGTNALGVNPAALQAAQAQRMRNPAVTNNPPTPRPQPASNQVPGEAGPPGAPPQPSGADAMTAMAAAQQQQNATNQFGLTPEQMQQRMDRADALNRYQMGTAGLGYDLSNADKLESFGKTFANPKGGRSGVARINAALSGAAEGYSAGSAMAQRKKVAEALKQLRDQHLDEQDPNRRRSRGDIIGGTVFEDDESFPMGRGGGPDEWADYWNPQDYL